MTSPSARPPQDPMPEYLKAITELTRLTEDIGPRRYLRDYGALLAVTVGYAIIEFLRPGPGATQFFTLLSIVFVLHGVTERRAQRQLRAQHTVLLHLLRHPQDRNKE